MMRSAVFSPTIDPIDIPMPPSLTPKTIFLDIRLIKGSLFFPNPIIPDHSLSILKLMSGRIKFLTCSTNFLRIILIVPKDKVDSLSKSDSQPPPISNLFLTFLK